MSPLILSLAMFNKFALSTAVGSFTAKTIERIKVMVQVLGATQRNKVLPVRLVQTLT